MKKRNLSILSLSLTALLLIPQNVMAITQYITSVEANQSATHKSTAYIENNGHIQYISPISETNSAPGTDTNNSTKPTNIRKSQLKNISPSNSNQNSPSSNSKETEADKVKKEKKKRRPTLVSNQLIITFKDGTTETVKKSVRSKNKLKNKEDITSLNASLVELPKGKTVEEAAKLLKADPNVEDVQPNYLYYSEDATISTDPRSSELWGLENNGQLIKGTPGTNDIDIDAQAAWNITKGNSNLVIGVIDSGIDINHPDLKDRIWTNPKEIPNDGIDNDGNGYIDDIHGWDFYNNDNTVFDANDGDVHGTHVAGTIAASMNNTGVVGVAPNVKIMSLKFLGPDGNGDTVSAIKAINYASKMGVKITNNSWGGSNADFLLSRAITRSNSLFVAAAGNDSADIDIINDYPASFNIDNMLTVAAVDNNGSLGWFSNYGVTNVDVAAPGVSILSTIPKKQNMGAAIGSNTGTYKTLYQGFGLESIYQESQRNDYMKKALNHFGIISGDKILLVQDDEHGAPSSDLKDFLVSYKGALDSLATSMGFSVDVNTVPYNSAGPDAATLSQYKLVIWFTGNGRGQFSTVGSGALTPADRNNLSTYLSSGGNLFLASTKAASDPASHEFINNYLHASYNTKNEILGKSSVMGEAGTAFEGTSYSLIPTSSIDYLGTYDNLGKVTLYYPGDADYSNAYDYHDGTSMAAPHVTGIAALLLSKDQNLKPIELKNAIMRSTKYAPNLLGKIATAGIVNAERALTMEADDNIPGLPLAQSPISGTLDSISDLNDVFSVYLSPGEQISFNLTGDRKMDFDLHLYDSTTFSVDTGVGLLQSSENEGTSSENITFTAINPGIYYINVYAFSGAGSYTLTYDKTGDIVFDDKDPALNFTGNWIEESSNKYLGRTAKTLNSEGSMLLRFTGSKIVWKGFKSPTQGIASIFIDGQFAGNASLYSSTIKYNQEIFNKNLPYSPHTIEIKWTGLWDEASGKKTSTAINVDSIMVTNTNIPMAPQNLYTEQFLNAVNLTFTNKDFVNTKVNIYRSEDGVNYTLIDSQPVYPFTMSYLDKGVQNKLYYYKLTTVNSLGTESSFSNVAEGRPLVANSTFTLDDSSNHIVYTGAWAVEDKLGAYNDKVHTTTEIGAKAIVPFTGYNLKIKFYGGIGIVKITSPFGTVWHLDLSRYQDATYFSFYDIPRQVNEPWAIECVSGKVSFDAVEVEDLTETAPTAPSNLQAAKDGTNVNLTWKDNAEIDVMGYNIYRSTVKGVKGDKLNAALINPLTFTDSTTDTTITYYYTISAVNYAGLESGISNEVEVLGEAGSQTPVTTS